MSARVIEGQFRNSQFAEFQFTLHLGEIMFETHKRGLSGSRKSTEGWMEGHPQWNFNAL
jgi:hypothetical protein